MQTKKWVPEQDLKELQRGFSYPITDSEDLRQPYISNNEAGRDELEQRYAIRTFTTYGGVYEDPF